MTVSTYKPAQPLALRQLNRKFVMDHKNVQNKKCQKSAEKLIVAFGREFSIHGINRIFHQNSTKFERLFWLLTLCCTIIGSIYVCLILSKRYYDGILETIIDSTNTPVYRIPFPEVSICNTNHLNWDRLEEAKHHFMPHENDTEKIRLFETVIGLYDNISFGNFAHFKVLKDLPIQLVNNINFSLVADFMSWRCEELLTQCMWRRYKINCCDMFLRSKGNNGICWHFNTLSTEEGRRKQLLDKKYPYRTGSAAPRSGLVVRVMLHTEKHYNQANKKGITVGIMEPEVFYKAPYWVPVNTETVVEVEPIIYKYENDTRSLSTAQRKCVFNDERNSYDFKSLLGFKYMIENCQTQCHQEYLLKYCNCTVDLLFPPAEYRACTVKDFLCLAKNNDYFRFYQQYSEENYVNNDYHGMVCKCFRNCYSLNYITDVRATYLPAYLRDNKTCIDLDVHFRFGTMMVYSTSLVFGWVDLMVAFGGVAGLFLGCSLISAIELIYFVVVELPVFMLNQLKANAKYMRINYLETKKHKKVLLGRHNWGLNNRITAAENKYN